jgi:hypothetical protein
LSQLNTVPGQAIALFDISPKAACCLARIVRKINDHGILI